LTLGKLSYSSSPQSISSNIAFSCTSLCQESLGAAICFRSILLAQVDNA
jgi:hypothetical protein